MSDDIRPIIKNWPYRPGKISVRRIVGDDGRPKIQMRLDLGLIQLEPTGRPDGKRPKGHASVLNHCQEKLKRFRREHDTDLGFELLPEDCRGLREEALMYYHRYLACFILEDYAQVIRDTLRNLRVFDLCHRYAAKRMDRMVLEQYRPYVLMMNTRAKAHQSAKEENYAEALAIIKAGMRSIKKVYADLDQVEEFADSVEAAILRQLRRKIRKKLPVDPLKRLEKRLQRAVDEERYERAAELRDRIDELNKSRQGDTPT